MELKQLIYKGIVCQYCEQATELIDSSEIFGGQSFGKIYICRSCNAYVGCHRGTDRSYGSVAKPNLRLLRHQAHHWFDAIWKNKIKKSRYNAYSWLALRLDLNKDFTHIGFFNEESCKKVINLCSEYIKKRRPDLWEDLKLKQPQRSNI